MTEVSLGEQPPTLLRRHAAGTDSARSVLFTVLGELLGRADAATPRTPPGRMQKTA